MFANLIESASHASDLKRRSSFFFGTLVAYAILLTAAGIASVYAYKAHLENENLEIVEMLPPAPVETPAPRATNNASHSNEPRRIAVLNNPPIEDLSKPARTPDKISSEKTNQRIAPDVPFKIDPSAQEFLPDTGRTIPNGRAGAGDSAARNQLVRVDDASEPPAIKPPKVEKPKQQTLQIGNMITGKAVYKYQPPYPMLARQARVSGAVTVNVLVDETGKVISARVVSGHPLLAQAARDAAYQWRFSPTILDGAPVKVSGLITFNFVLQ